MPLNLLWTRSSYFCLFFLFKYNELIIKQASSCTFCIKVVKFLENFGRLKKIKNHSCLAPSRIWASVGCLGWLDNIEYGITFKLNIKRSIAGLPLPFIENTWNVKSLNSSR